MNASVANLGCEWLVDAHACDPQCLRSQPGLAALLERVVLELDLHPAAAPQWHVFPGAGGVTGLWLLQESHLTCHTFPERAFATFNLYCCRPRPAWPWDERLTEVLHAERVNVRCIERGQP